MLLDITWPPKAHMKMAWYYCGVEPSSQEACLRWALQDFHPSPLAVHLPGHEVSRSVLSTLLPLLVRHIPQPHQGPQNNDSAWLWTGNSKTLSQVIFSLCKSFRIFAKGEKLGNTERKRLYIREGLWVNCGGGVRKEVGGRTDYSLKNLDHGRSRAMGHSKKGEGSFYK